jgi:Phosphatidylglycerophosphate synthase
MHRYFTISNFLSASRIFLVIPMGYCLVLDFPYHRLWTAGIIVIAVATDLLDGFLARKLHQVTDLGQSS